MVNPIKNILKKSKNTTVNLGIINNSTPFPIREAYRTLYTDVLYLNIEDRCKKIAVTSAIPGECKSTATANLAVTIAHSAEDKRVLLIDTDMRKPTVANLFGINKMTHGLSEFLAGIDDTPNFINVPQHRITVLTSGGINKNPTKLISSKRMQELITFSEQYFDYIIIDTPPVNVVSDALLLHDKINGYIISVKSDFSNINYVNECVERLNRIDAEIFGFVLNAHSVKRGRSRYGNYSKYDYTSESSR